MAATNPPYQQNLERDAKLVAAGFRGEQVFMRVAAGMGLWRTPQDAVDYAKQIREQPQKYRHEVGRMATALLYAADGTTPPKPTIISGRK